MKNDNLLNKKVYDEAFISTRMIKAFDLLGIVTFKDLIETTEKTLLSVPNFGRSGIKEIKELLDSFSLTLGTNFEEHQDNHESKHNNQIRNENFEDEEKQNLFNIEDLKIFKINIIDEWPLSVRTYNAIKSLRIYLLGDLLHYGLDNLLNVKNFGRKSLMEIDNLLRNNNIDIIKFNPSEWEKIREDFVYEDTKKRVDIQILKNNWTGIKKSTFKDFDEFKKQKKLQKRVFIENNSNALDLEKLILEDINIIINTLNDRNVAFFKGRYGYLENFKTLDTLGKEFGITRERVRQIENNLNSALSKIGNLDKKSLIEYFNKYEFISFHKIFPQLNKNFTDTVRNAGETSRDKLTVFMENYCGVEEKYFKTPERELWHFDLGKLEEIFSLYPSGLEKESFHEVIKENFGYNDFVSKSAIEFMSDKKLIKIHDNKIYPLKMRKNLEVTHILVSYPEGLHWRKIAEIGNNSFTSNKWDLNRIVGDGSINMLTNQSIYLFERGSYRLFRHCPEIKNKTEIINFFINYLQDNNLEQSPMEPPFKEITNLSQFQDLNFYDARAIIKKFGAESGLFHKGTSGTNTISLNKNIKVISLKEKIKDIISNAPDEIHLQDIIKKLQKTNEDIPVDQHLNDLVDEMKIFRISPGTFLNFDDAIKLCDKEDVKKELEKLLENYEFITSGFMREKINDELGFNLSNFYYDTLSRILAKENEWFYGSNCLSNKNEKVMSAQQYIKEQYDDNLSKNDNYENISKKIGISKMYFDNIVYQSINNFNTDWIHED